MWMVEFVEAFDALESDLECPGVYIHIDRAFRCVGNSPSTRNGLI